MKLKPEKKSALNGIWIFCDTGAVLYQLSYQANWKLVRLCVRNIPVGEEYKWIYEGPYGQWYEDMIDLRSYAHNLRWPNTIFARALADAIQSAYKDCKNKHAVDTAIILFAQCPLYLCFFFRNWTQCVGGFSLYNKGMLENVTTQKTQQFSDFFCSVQLNTAQAQLLEKLRPIAFAETCRFLTIQSLEFQEIWQNIV